MTADLLVERLRGAGLHPHEAARKRALCATVLEAFQHRSGRPAAHAWWIPGRLEVFGKHTDYGGGHSLVATVPRGFVLAARERRDGLVRLFDAARRQEFSVAVADERGHTAGAGSGGAPYGGLTGWRRYAMVVVHRLLRNFPGALRGAEIAFASDLPSASGMSSSSALVVGVIAALVEIGAVRHRPEWHENIQSAADEAGYYASFENGMTFGSLAGDAGVGTHGGSEDHIAIVCGAPGRLSAWSFVPIAHVADVAVPGNWRFAIAASGAPAQKTGSAQAAYNDLSARVASLLELWNRTERPQPSLCAAITSRPDAPARMRDLLAGSGLPGSTIAGLTTRLEHLVREDRRVVEAVAACRESDESRIGALSDASQREADTLLGNQVPETTALARLARELGAFAASAFGAGFGGSVWAIVHPEALDAFLDRWLEAYRIEFPARTAAVTFAAPPGPPLTQLV